MANPRLVRRTLVLAKLESSYGTFETPSASTDALQATDFGIRFISGRAARDVLKDTLGDLPDVVTDLYAEVTFSVELKGGGIDADNNVVEPRIGRLFQACGMRKLTSTADVDGDSTDETANIYYMPTSDTIGGTNFKSLSLEIYHGATASGSVVRYQIAGALGTFALRAEVGRFPTIEFTFTGLVTDVSDATMPTASFESTEPNPWQACDFSLDSQTFMKPTTFELNIGNTVALRRAFTESDGIVGPVITDRAVTGSVNPEAFTETDYALYSKFRNGATAVVDVGPIGSDTDDKGNVIRIYAPKVQVTDYAFGDRDGILTYELPLKFCEDSGDDEFRIEFMYDSTYKIS